MHPAWVLLAPLLGLGLYTLIWWVRGGPGGRAYLNLVVSLWVLLYFLLTAGLGVYWVARMDLPVLDIHYLAGYVLFLLVALHVALQWPRLWRAFRRGWVFRALLGVLTATGVVLPLPLVISTLASRLRPSPPPVIAPPQLPSTPRGQVRIWAPPRQWMEVSSMKVPVAAWIYEFTSLRRWGRFRFPPVRNRPPEILWEDPRNSLPPPRDRLGIPYREGLRRRLHPPDPHRHRLTLQELSDLLYHTYGVTGVRRSPGRTLHLRAVPSAGALYPLDLYVLVEGIDGLKDGLYYYHPRAHALVYRTDLPIRDRLRQALLIPDQASAPLLFILCATWDRTAWKYQDRAWRYVLLDGGHLLNHLTLVAAALGLPLTVEPRFDDLALTEALGLSPETSGCLAVVGPRDLAPTLAYRPAPLPPPDRLSATATAHLLTAWRRTGDVVELPPPPPLPTPPDPDPSQPDADLFAIIRARRSVRTYASQPLPAEALHALVQEALAFPPIGAPEALHLFLILYRGADMSPGVYRWDATRQRLTLIREGDFREAVYRAGVEQELLRNAAAVVIWALDPERVGSRDGDRDLRTGLMEAGMGGGNVYLSGAIRGWGVCGVGAFFDDELQDILGNPVWPVYMLAIGPRI